MKKYILTLAMICISCSKVIYHNYEIPEKQTYTLGIYIENTIDSSFFENKKAIEWADSIDKFKEAILKEELTEDIKLVTLFSDIVYIKDANYKKTKLKISNILKIDVPIENTHFSNYPSDPDYVLIIKNIKINNFSNSTSIGPGLNSYSKISLIESTNVLWDNINSKVIIAGIFSGKEEAPLPFISNVAMSSSSKFKYIKSIFERTLFYNNSLKEVNEFK